MNNIWRNYTIHDDQNIKGFFGDYRWLSNFEPCKVIWDGVEYPSSENAYQAAKTMDHDLRIKLSKVIPADSKKISKSISIREDWDDIKVSIMYNICLDKFTRNPELGTKLIDTEDKYLEESNHWKDTFWGVCNGVGQNNLGKILMQIRDIIK